MKILHEMIRYCVDCPYARYDLKNSGFLCVCVHKKAHFKAIKKTELLKSVPDWCPLPDGDNSPNLVNPEPYQAEDLLLDIWRKGRRDKS